MALDKQLDRNDPLDETRLPILAHLQATTLHTPLLDDSTRKVPRLVELPPASLTERNGTRRARLGRLHDKHICLECRIIFRPEGRSQALCNICGLRAWGTRRAEEYSTLVNRFTAAGSLEQ